MTQDRRSRVGLRLSIVAWLLSVSVAGVSAATVEEMLKSYPVRRGVACVPACGDGAAAMELASTSEFLILALDEDAAKVRELKQKAAAAGFLGRNLYVEQGSLEALPLADHYVDLMALSHVAKAGLSGKAREEIERVLVPIHGKAFFKDGVIEKPELPGSDWWMHKLHGPNNNFASQDTVFQWPPVLQYLQMPFHNAYQGSALSVPGRHVEISDWVNKDPWRSGLSGRLIVRSSYNGMILWDDLIPENIEANMPVFAAAGNELFLAAGDRAAVIRRSLDDGRVLDPVVLGGTAQRVRWLAIDNEVLFTLIGPDAPVRAPFEWIMQHDIRGAQYKNQTLFGSVLTATDLKTRRTLWTHAEPAPIDFRMVAISNGKILFYSEKSRLAALAAADGGLLWENTERAWIDLIKRPPRQTNVNIESMSTLAAGVGLIRATPFESGISLLFREQDGRFLTTDNGRFLGAGQKMPIVSVDGKVYVGKTETDPVTGQKKGGQLPSPAGTAWCGIATYAPGIGLIGHSSMTLKSPCGVGAWVAGGVLSYFPTVCDCGAAPGSFGFVSGAEVFRRMLEAPEHPLIKGPSFGKTAASRDAPSEWAAYRGGIRHSGASSADITVKADDLSWIGSPAVPFAFSTNYNQFGLDFDDRPVPPIAAGGLAYTAGSDGIVRALSLSDGEPVWTFYADGPVFTSPALHRGLVFIAGGDGAVYALDAHSGELAWKRRLAPVERRVLMYGKLMSTWPVFSMLADEGRVYAVAGHWRMSGSKAFALDAATGEVLWSRAFEPYVTQFTEYPLDHYSFGGNLTLIKGKLWAAGFNSVPMVLSAAIGEPQIPGFDAKFSLFQKRGYGTFAARFESNGQDIINLDDRAVLVGGNYLLEEQHLHEAKKTRMNYKLYQTDDSGLPVLDVARLPSDVLYHARIAPAYDADDIAFVARSSVKVARDGRVTMQIKVPVANAGLNFWNKEEFISAGTSLQTASAVGEASGGDEAAAAGSPGNTVNARGIFKDIDYGKARWQQPDALVNSIALAKNALVVAGAAQWKDMSKDKDRVRNRGPLMDVSGWRLAAYDRANGMQMWSVPLPSEPLYNGIAIASDGTVIAALRDGRIVGIR